MEKKTPNCPEIIAMKVVTISNEPKIITKAKQIPIIKVIFENIMRIFLEILFALVNFLVFIAKRICLECEKSKRISAMILYIAKERPYNKIPK